MSLYYILGLGQTGLSVVRYLHRHHHDCEVFDDKMSLAGLAEFQKEFPNIPVHLHQQLDLNLDDIKKVREVIISPGVPLEHPIARKAKELGISVVGDIELFARQNHTPVVAITGTNGKSTVTTLVGEMAKAAGLKVMVGGNIGEPVLNLCEEDFDWIVLELSSFQLESTFTLCPNVACILNITEDHMDRYPDYAAYIAAKHRIYNQAENIVFSGDDALTKPLASPSKALVSFGLNALENHSWGIQEQDNNQYLAEGSEFWLNVNEMKIKGTHNWANALAALAIGKLMGLSQTTMCNVLRQFSGLDHRCQWVRELNQITWYNDSKGTNVGATLSAIKGLGGTISGKIVLLLGGQAKDADFSDLRMSLQSYVRAIILYGQDADRIEKMLENTVPIVRLNVGLNDFDKVIHRAQKEACSGDAVLLSPACASWDMFDNFIHRGKVFTEMVHKL